MGTSHPLSVGSNNHALTANPNATGAFYADVTALNADTDFNALAANLNKIVGVTSPLSLHWLQSSGVFKKLLVEGDGGDVFKVGTPVDNQVGVWTGDGTLEGTTGLIYDGSSLSVTGTFFATGDITASTNGSSEATPRVMAFMDLSAGEAGRIQFGDAFNALQLGFNRAMDIYSFHTLRLVGNRGLATALPFSSESGIGVQVINTVAGTPALVVDGAAAQTGDLFQARNSASTVLASISSAGFFKAPNGTELLPGYSFVSDPDTGMRRVSADVLGFSAKGFDALQLTALAGADNFIRITARENTIGDDGPLIESLGTEDDIPLCILSKGLGPVLINSESGAASVGIGRSVSGNGLALFDENGGVAFGDFSNADNTDGRVIQSRANPVSFTRTEQRIQSPNASQSLDFGINNSGVNNGDAFLKTSGSELVFNTSAGEPIRISGLNVTILGDLTVSGTTTTLDTATLLVEDKNIELGVVATPTDITADGGGITLKGATDKTITWSNANNRWDFNQGINVTSGTITIAGNPIGDVTKVGTPVDNQVGVWTGDGTIEGTTGLTYDGSQLHVVAGNFQVNAGLFFVDAVMNLVGIGTTGPLDRLHISVSSGSPIGMRVQNTNSAGVARSQVLSDSKFLLFDVNGSTRAGTLFGLPAANFARLITDGDALAIETTVSAPIILAPNNTETMRLTANVVAITGQETVGTVATPLTDLTVFQAAGNLKGITLSGVGVTGSSTTEGVSLFAGNIGAGNNQLWIVNKVDQGNSLKNSFRFITGTDCPLIVGVNNIGTLNKNLCFGINTLGAGMGLGFPVGTLQADIKSKLHIQTGVAAEIGQIIQGAVSQTADLFQIQNSASAVLAKFEANGNFTVDTLTFHVEASSKRVGIGALTPTATLDVNSSAAGDIVLVVQGTVGQTADLFNAEETGGDVVFSITAAGKTGVGETSPLSRLHVKPSASEIGLIIQGNTLQTADLLQMKDQVGTVFAKIDSIGRMHIGPDTVADARLHVSAGESGAVIGMILQAQLNQSVDIFQVKNSVGTVLGRTDFNGNVSVGQAVPNSKLHVEGSFSVERLGTPGSNQSSDEVIIGVTSTASPVTITIQTSDIVEGRLFIIKDESGGAVNNNITIATQGSQTIDGAATVAITQNYGVIRLYASQGVLHSW